ncbi:MAG: GNAT family N-acetyltransferase [Anaerolineae bacterium]
MTILFETERLVVRELEVDDLDDFYAITGDAELSKYMGDRQPLSREITQKWIDISINNYRTKGYGCSAVIAKDDGAFIGFCGLVYSDNIRPPVEAELIYALLKRCWGRGLATEVAGAMLTYGFEKCGLKRIMATIDPENTASARVVTKAGMTFYKNEVYEDGETTDFYVITDGSSQFDL